jgi:3-phosphoshikimate 1-carboxyvinyltransferase
MVREIARAPGPLTGAIRVPGDKSVSHRAVLMAAMAEGSSRLTGVLRSDDVDATIAAVRVLGASVDEEDAHDGRTLTITGWGPAGPVRPGAPIDCGNSGTTARLLAGVVAGWPIAITLTGDDSLSTRPMTRIAEPLRSMGARVDTSDDGCLPLTVSGGALRATDYVMPVASAQVKTAILLAGTRAAGTTRVTGSTASRDHTERMLPCFGVPVDRDGGASVDGPALLHGCDVAVPGDPSSATFLAVAAAIVPGSSVTLRGVMFNPTRIGALEALGRMGANVEYDETGRAAGEEVGDVTVSFSGALGPVSVSAEEVPSLIDEIPVLAIAASQAHGTSRFEGVGELRVKESDRLEAIGRALHALGARARWGDDWLEVTGPAELGGADLDSLGDHRLAMAYHVAGLVATSPVRIDHYEAIDVSYPDFANDVARLTHAD